MALPLLSSFARQKKFQHSIPPASDAHRQIADGVAQELFATSAPHSSTRLILTIRKEVSREQLDELQGRGRRYPEFYQWRRSTERLMTFVEAKINLVNFSNGYEKTHRAIANLLEIAPLFSTFVTIQQSYERQCKHLDENRKDPQIKATLSAWFEAAMGNLCLKLLKNVAQSNRESRQGQRAKYAPESETWRYVNDRITDLDLKQNPAEWAAAALYDLKKFFHLDERKPTSPKEQQMIKVLNDSLKMLRYYSHIRS